MKKLVSFFGDRNAMFEELNQLAEEYGKERGVEFVWVPQVPYDVDDVVKNINNADAALIDVEAYDEKIFSRLNDRCKLLVRFGVGFDKVNLPDCNKYGIAAARTNGANKTGTAEMALTLMLACRRLLQVNRKVMESGKWEKNVGHELIGKKVGILGFGNIGKTLARLLRGFDVETLVYDVYHNDETAREYGIRYADMDEIFSTCDAISVHMPLNDETYHSIDAARFKQMKKDATIVCNARGNIIDEDALYDALKNGDILGAGLDVYGTEPLPVDSRLLELDNLIVTPHVSSQTFESLWYVYKMAVDITADFFEGKPLEHGVLFNPEYKDNAR